MSFSVVNGKLNYNKKECDLNQIAILLNAMDIDEDDMGLITIESFQLLNRFNIGDLVEIKDDEHVYAGYDKWANHHGFDNTILYTTRPRNLNTKCGRIIAKGPHLDRNISDIIYGIEISDDMKIIISGSGIDHVR